MFDLPFSWVPSGRRQARCETSLLASSRRKYDLLQFPFRTHNDLHIMFEWRSTLCTGSLYNNTALRLISAFCMITRLLACGSQLSHFYKTRFTILLFNGETVEIFFFYNFTRQYLNVILPAFYGETVAQCLKQIVVFLRNFYYYKMYE